MTAPPSRSSAALAMPSPTSAPSRQLVRQAMHERRQVTQSQMCGYINGASTRPVIAPSGSICRQAMSSRLWGFCDNSITNGTGCGRSGTATVTCSKQDDYCATDVLTHGIDIQLSYLYCWFTPEVNIVALKPSSVAETTLPHTGRVDETTTPASSPEPSTSSEPQSSEPQSSGPASSEQTKSSSSASLPESSTETTSTASSTASSTPSLAIPAPSSTPTEPPNTSSGPRLNIAAIIGGVLGGLALICITTILVIYIVRTNRREKRLNPKNPKPKPKLSFITISSNRKTRDSDASSEDTIRLDDTRYPDPPDDKAHPEAGWGPSEAYGSEVQPHRGPWELLNDERPTELSDHNRPAELPDYAFLETLPTVAQAPTRQDSWRPNDDGAAWGDVRPPPRVRDRLRYAAAAGAAPQDVGPGARAGARDGRDGAAECTRGGRTGTMAANFASSAWDGRHECREEPKPRFSRNENTWRGLSISNLPSQVGTTANSYPHTPHGRGAVDRSSRHIGSPESM
ncbi:hypothetical protein Cob_v012723 [Colletotrichum orbiculare MAFF 240422]|uniref:Uncharacterized protein n=1 Tax=Colletotrichum orbiculare (strain 104-T / ATCC 96160 / CBS 514.97 / LARS 414 / MAFF 240422) TaxID=1213857 RepID=A0A484F7X3_COLOR|nr:hypothetical protein Cob_v012723 [Colletotrichum orbiculare MAFF 240422]